MVDVRMGELFITSDPDQELVARGLGSCVGVAMVDHQAGVAGLAHVVLPESEGPDAHAAPARYADRAVGALLDAMCAAGARHDRVQVALAGGACMFPTAKPLDIGARNQAAVHEALSAQRLRCAAAALGGDRGRTLRVGLGQTGVTSTSAGETPVQLLAPSDPRTRVRSRG
jgi:chemotaxis protein CheD